MIGVDYLSALPEDLFLYLIFPLVDIKKLQQIRAMSKQLKYLVDKYREFCNNPRQLRLKCADRSYILPPDIYADIYIDRRARIVVNDYSRVKSLTFNRCLILVDLAKFTALKSLVLNDAHNKYYTANNTISSELKCLKFSSDRLAISDSFIAYIRDIFKQGAFNKIKHLTLRHIYGRYDLTQLTKLTYLDIVGGNIKLDLQQMSSLTYLSLTNLYSSPAIRVSGLHKLSYLHIHNCEAYITATDIIDLVNLTHIYTNNIKVAPDISILTKLTYCSIAQTAYGIPNRDYLKSQTNLKYLCLTNSISFAPIEIGHLIKLQHLNLTHIGYIPHLPYRITKLEVIDIRITKLLDLTYLPYLKELRAIKCECPIKLPRYYIKKRYIKECPNVITTYNKLHI